MSKAAVTTSLTGGPADFYRFEHHDKNAHEIRFFNIKQDYKSSEI